MNVNRLGTFLIIGVVLSATSQPQPDQGGDQAGDLANAWTLLATCDSTTGTDPQGDVVVNDVPSIDDAR